MASATLIKKTMENFLQQDYTPPKNNSSYMRFEEGENRFRVMSSAIIGFEYWTADNKPVRSKTPFQETPNAKLQNGKVSIKHFWAFVVWSPKDKKIMILEITQNGIQNAIFGLTKNPDWGAPQKYDIIVNRTGQDFDTKYNVMPCPHKEISQEAMDAYNETKINLEALYTGADPWQATATIQDGQIAPAPENFDEQINNIPIE